MKTTSGKIARQWCRRAFLDGKMKPLLHLTSGKKSIEGGGGVGDGVGGGNGGVRQSPGAGGDGGGKVLGGSSDLQVTLVTIVKIRLWFSTPKFSWM